MVRLADEDIRTREVLDWSGVHLMHAPGSSCSQKTRIVLNLKGLPWEGHVIDLKASANYEAWYLGINPRGLVPCLVHDGAVHIESNDIIEYLEETFPYPALIPEDSRPRISSMLQMEDDLHRDLRVLTFRYVIPTRAGEIKNRASLDRLRKHNGTIAGQPDTGKADEIQFWDSANANGITDQQVAESVGRFKAAFEQLNSVLHRSYFAVGDSLTVADIAWYVYTARLINAGYPMHALHPHVGGWFDLLDSKPLFHKEVQLPPPMKMAAAELQQQQRDEGRALDRIAVL